jgi:hypothetical protein
MSKPPFRARCDFTWCGLSGWEMKEGEQAYQRRQLEGVANEDEAVGESERAEARRQRDLGGFVHDAIVKLAARE